VNSWYAASRILARASLAWNGRLDAARVIDSSLIALELPWNAAYYTR
jgi:hypothetical protein